MVKYKYFKLRDGRYAVHNERTYQTVGTAVKAKELKDRLNKKSNKRRSR